MSLNFGLNFGQFPTPTLPVAASDFVVGYQTVDGVPILARYTWSQAAVALGPLLAGLPPIGPAGGDLSGTYPNPTVSAVHATSGSISNVSISSGTLSGAAISTSSIASATSIASTPTSGAGLAIDPAGTNSPYVSFTNGGTSGLGLGYVGFDVAGGTLIGGSTAKALVVGSVANNPLQVGVNNAIVGTFTSTGLNNTAVGQTTAQAGNFTTLRASSTITPSTTAGIVGTTAADNANGGSVGEYLAATFVNLSVAASTLSNAAAMTLTPGDWDVSGCLEFVSSGSFSNLNLGVSTVSATPGAGGTYTQATQPTGFGSSQNWALATPTVRINVSSNTAVYLVVYAGIVGGTGSANVTGTFRARRMR